MLKLDGLYLPTAHCLLFFILHPSEGDWYNASASALYSSRPLVIDINPTVQSWGNFSFTVDVRDGDLLDPRQADGFAITIQDNGGAVWRQLGTSAALLQLGGGNVQVKGK